MKSKVICYGNREDFESKLNLELKSIDNDDLIDVKYSCFMDSYGVYIFTAVIIYDADSQLEEVLDEAQQCLSNS